MRESVAILWADALESGGFQQGKGRLTRTTDPNGKLLKAEEDCCLGVLCKVAIANGLLLRVDRAVKSSVYYGERLSAALLPREVVSWAGFCDIDPSFPEPTHSGGRLNFSNANDGFDMTFSELATIIRENWAEIR